MMALRASRPGVWQKRALQSTRRCHPFSTCRNLVEEGEVEATRLATLEGGLQYPGSSTTHGPWKLVIHPASTGGHALLGRNGTDKSLVKHALVSHGASEYLKQGSFTTEEPSSWHLTNPVAHVSFQSHRELLLSRGSVFEAISGGRNLSKAAQFLIVRFGLYPLLHRQVDTLSTGEIRKVMLVRALASRPRLLILDNAFDGLDVPSRETLKDLVSRTISGFRPDILVQGVSASATAHTQVLLMTHRAEEIVDEVSHIGILDANGKLTSSARDGRSGAHLLHAALHGDEQGETIVSETKKEPWNMPSLPSVDEIRHVWSKSSPQNTEPCTNIINAKNLSIKHGEATILSNLHWTVNAGECWLIAGGNGAGKSTLSRLLAKQQTNIHQETLKVLEKQETNETKDGRRKGVGWVSTELHMAVASSTQTVQQILQGVTCENNNVQSHVPQERIQAVASWLGITPYIKTPFSHLSQGQQKLVLLGAAFASMPTVLVLDEPCQGLDLLHRHLVLGLCERFCQATGVSLVYITHHLEEMIPSVSHVLHLVEGRVLYKGPRTVYDPTECEKDF